MCTRRIAFFTIFSLMLPLGYFLPVQPTARADTAKISVKFGLRVQSGNHSFRAKSRDSLKAGDQLQVWIKPLSSGQIYLVYSDHTKASLLEDLITDVDNSLIILPSARSYYRIDGASPKEHLTIVFSPGPLPELATLQSGDISHAQWHITLEQLKQRSLIRLSELKEKTFSIGGNTRSMDKAGQGNNFSNELVAYSGNEFVIKDYEFKIKE